MLGFTIMNAQTCVRQQVRGKNKQIYHVLICGTMTTPIAQQEAQLAYADIKTKLIEFVQNAEKEKEYKAKNTSLRPEFACFLVENSMNKVGVAEFGKGVKLKRRTKMPPMNAEFLAEALEAELGPIFDEIKVYAPDVPVDIDYDDIADHVFDRRKNMSVDQEPTVEIYTIKEPKEKEPPKKRQRRRRRQIADDEDEQFMHVPEQRIALQSTTDL